MMYLKHFVILVFHIYESPLLLFIDFPFGNRTLQKIKECTTRFYHKKIWNSIVLLTGRFSLTADGTLRCIGTVTKQKYID
jgi:hypothetical protein